MIDIKKVTKDQTLKLIILCHFSLKTIIWHFVAAGLVDLYKHTSLIKTFMSSPSPNHRPTHSNNVRYHSRPVISHYTWYGTWWGDLRSRLLPVAGFRSAPFTRWPKATSLSWAKCLQHDVIGQCNSLFQDFLGKHVVLPDIKWIKTPHLPAKLIPKCF